MNTILVGTAKGLIVFEQSGETWSNKAIHFQGFPVSMIFVDERTGRWWLGLSHRHWGCKLHYSDNQGAEWKETQVPTFNGAKLPKGEPAKLYQIWSMAAAGKEIEDGLWLGAEPGSLFYSKDNGEKFELVESLWNHPSHIEQDLWFGAGTDHPVIHSIQVDAQDPNHLFVAISCAGVFESWDKGLTWEVKNKGLIAEYLPNRDAEIGHDPHTMFLHPQNNKVLWQQNHCGVFCTKDGAATWLDVSGENKLPYFGFALALEAENPATAYVIPVESEVKRTAPNFRLQVLRTTNYGETWEDQSKGLPNDLAFDIVLRHAFTQKNKLLAFGTNNGNLYCTEKNDSEQNDLDLQWTNITNHLPKITNVVIV